MNILVIGSGGREHTFAYKIAQSNKTNQLFIAPGNAGTSELGTNLPISVSDFDGIKSAVLEHNINLVVVGPEAPLVDGIYDYFQSDEELSSISVIGPSKEGAQLEGSKEFSKIFMEKYGVPTARYQSFTANNLEEGYSFLETLNPPFVLKADGLAAGKGVLILNDINGAKAELREPKIWRGFSYRSNRRIFERN
jgi:phosphoribosylamine--glycine ligase